MARKLRSLLLMGMVAFSGGCTLCCAPFDYEYSAYGGRWERGDRCNGRVGSAFAPAEIVGSGDENLGEPPTDVATRPEAAGDTYYE